MVFIKRAEGTISHIYKEKEAVEDLNMNDDKTKEKMKKAAANLEKTAKLSSEIKESYPHLAEIMETEK